MEAFSLLKYWRASANANANANAKTIVDAPSAPAAVDTPYSSDGEDGPYFDLEFALPDQESDSEENKAEESGHKVENSGSGDDTDNESDEDEISEEDDEVEEVKFALAGDDCTDQNAAVSVSPSDELFFKGDLVSVEPSSILSEENSKIPVFLLKSATKFRVLMLKLKKSKPEKSNEEEAAGDGKEHNQGGRGNGAKFFAVKFKVDEVPIVSLFTRDSSSKETQGKSQKINPQDSDAVAPLEDKKLTKEVVQKYLKMVKPFYVRVSKRYVEKMKISGHLSFPGGGSNFKPCIAAAVSSPPETVTEPEAPPPPPPPSKNNLQAGLMVVRKRLGKSRSASAAPLQTAASNRRDDSLLQLHDGIQGAILHCKRSFNASRDGESSSSTSSSSSSSSSILCRSVSDPSHEKSVVMPKPEEMGA